MIISCKVCCLFSLTPSDSLERRSSISVSLHLSTELRYGNVTKWLKWAKHSNYVMNCLICKVYMPLLISYKIEPNELLSKNLYISRTKSLMMMMMMMMMMKNCFCGVVVQQKAFSLIYSWDHSQRSSPLWIFDMQPAGFEPA